MDITYKFQKIPVSVNKQRFIAALKEMAHLISSTVYITGIAKTDILHYAGQGDISNLDMTPRCSVEWYPEGHSHVPL